MVPVRCLSDGTLSQSDFFLEVSKGTVTGHSSIHKFGGNPSVPNGSYTDVWHQGGTLSHLEAASTVHLISNNAGDNQATTTGVRGARIFGLDANFLEIQEDLLMHATDGTIAGPSSANTFTRIYRVVALSAGAYSRITNLGAINVVEDTGSTVQASIGAGDGQSHGSHYTIPSGKTGYLKRISVTMDTGKSVDVQFFVRDNADDTIVPVSPIKVKHHWFGIAEPIEEIFYANNSYDEKTDLWFEAKGNGAVAKVEVDYDIILVNN
jgi:hypothetical protein